MQKMNYLMKIMKEDKDNIEDLIVAAHNNAKSELKTKPLKRFQKPQVDLEFLVLNGHYNQCKILVK